VGVRHELYSPAIGATGGVVVHGHWGRPFVCFPAEQGNAREWEERGMVAAVRDLLDTGRAKLYCVDSYDNVSWSDASKPLEERAIAHGRWEDWLLNQVVPFVREDCGGAEEVALAGVSMGAYHAANLALKHAHRFPLAICLSGNYDPGAWNGWGERGDATYFNNPLDYVGHLEGGHLDWLRSQVNLLLVVGQGQWEDTTGALESSRRLAGLLWAKGLRCELDLWGSDVPHDWPSWRRQLAHHLPRFC